MDFHLGANVDTRPQALKDKDYHADEIAGALAVTPFTHAKITALTAHIFNQWYVSDCVPHGFFTTLEYEGILPATLASQLVTYRQRANYAEAGSIATDIWDKIRAGIKANAFCPTPDGFTEAQANAMEKVIGEKLPKDFNYFAITDFKTIPNEVAAGKSVAIFIYATEDEWSQEYVEMKDPTLKIGDAAAYVRHCVSLPPEGDFTENGKQWLTVHDSAKFGNRNLRYISLDFLLNRTFYAGKVYAAGTLPTPPAPTPSSPTSACQYGDKSDAVRVLQTYLVSKEKLDAQYVTGFYGALTAKAVLWWQLEHWEKFSENIPVLLNLNGHFWGPESIAIAT